MLVPLSSVGSPGLVMDQPAATLPPGRWSNGKNVRFLGSHVQQTRGHSALFTPSVAPYYFMEAPFGATNYWLYAGLAKIYAFYGNAHTDLTRVSDDYHTTLLDRWNGGHLCGIPFLNNGVDIPQVWNPVNPATKLVDLPDWPANTYCKVLRAYKNYLVALAVTKSSGVYYPRMVKWSDTAVPGSLPGSWDETDPTKDAGELVLGEGSATLIDCLPLVDFNILYTEDSTWLMRLSGTESIFAFSQLFDTSGILAQDCAAILNRQHFVVTQDDIIVHDGVRIDSVADKRVRKWFFSHLNSSVYYFTFVLKDRRNSEMWICFPQSGELCDTALIWNWRENTWTIRDLPNIRSGCASVRSPYYSQDLWDYGDARTWDEETEQTWNVTNVGSWAEALILSPPNTTGAVLVDDGANFGDDPIASNVERVDIAAAGMTQDGTVIIDATRYKELLAVWPVIEADAGTEVTVEVGAQAFPGQTVTWSQSGTFVVGTSAKVDLYATGRYLAVRLSCPAAWKLLELYIDVVPGAML